MSGPLSGLRVLAVEEYGVGPFATQLLADLGADVVKIENPDKGGDSSRHVPPFQEGTDSLYFESLNRGKASVVLDLKAPAGQHAFHALVRSADGVLNNLRSTTATALGLRYEHLRGINERIVCCSASGWGTEGPRAGQPAYDYLLQAYVGNMALTGEPGQPPSRSAVPWTDLSTGFAAALALVSGLLETRSTGVGRDLDVSMVDVSMSQWMYMATWYLSAGHAQVRQPLSQHPSVVPSQLFETAGGFLVVMVQTESFWQTLCRLLEKPELAADARFRSMGDRRANKRALLEILTPIFLTRSALEWHHLLAAHLPVGIVNSFEEAMDAYASEYPEQILSWEHDRLGPVRAIGCPIRFDGPRMPAVPAPKLGADTLPILRAAGLTDEEIAAASGLRGESCEPS